MDISLLLFYGLMHNILMQDYIPGQILTTEQLTDAREYFTNCTRGSENSWTLYNLLVFPIAPPGYLYKTRCSAAPHYDECVDSTIKKINTHLNSTQIDALTVWKKVDDDILKHMCNYTDKLDGFQKASCNSTGSECKINLSGDIPIYDIPKLREHCGEYKKFQSCVSTYFLNNCTPDYGQVFNGFINAVVSNVCSN